jgi:hypothetical protein
VVGIPVLVTVVRVLTTEMHSHAAQVEFYNSDTSSMRVVKGQVAAIRPKVDYALLKLDEVCYYRVGY